MSLLPIIIGSTRRGRQTPKVARFLQETARRISAVDVRLIDLADLHVPFLVDRMKYDPSPPDEVRRFAELISACRRFIVVSPEYNGGPPGVLKNALDHLTDEYENKLVGIVAVSGGPHGGRRCLAQLRVLFRRLDAKTATTSFIVNNVVTSFADDGTTDVASYHEAAEALIRDLLS